MKYYTKVFGCQMNYSDAERIATILEKLDLEPAFKNEADSPAKALASAGLIVFVTCGVRQSAEDRAYGQINNICKKYPKKKIILTGCLAHRKDIQRRLKGKVDLFCEINDFSKEIRKIFDIRYSIFDTKNQPYTDYLKIAPKYTNSYTAYIPIMTGCNNFCTYCVVPYARGREYSRPAENILKEVKKLVKRGYKEIILLGQNVNSYKSVISNSKFVIRKKSQLQITNYKLHSVNFATLLKLIDNIPGHFWISFLTSHPKDMSDELIEIIAKSLSASGGQKICEYISLPIQSGNNEILSKMNRNYTVSHYKNLVKKIRCSFRELNSRQLTGVELPSLSTDIIVGFPGETKKQFENTAKLLREMKFDMVYISQYSPRSETAALKLKDNVSKKEKIRREKVLTEILEKTALENNKKYIEKVVDVLVDKKLDKSLALRNAQSLALGRKKPSFDSKSFALEQNKYLAHTRTRKKVVFHSNKKIPVGSFVKVKIIRAKAFGLEGEIK